MLKRILLASLLLALPLGTVSAGSSDEKPWTQGPVTEVTYIRVADGKMLDYMTYLKGVWRQEHEAEKKAGLITDYRIFTTTPRSPEDPNLVLTVTFPNFAAFDRTSEFDAIAVKIEGGFKEADEAFADRSSIRKVLGSRLTQELILK